MSFYFTLQKSRLLSYQTENISLAVIIQNNISQFNFLTLQETFIKLNKTTFYVNFIKHKYKMRIYSYTHYTHGLLKTKQKPICI